MCGYAVACRSPAVRSKILVADRHQRHTQCNPARRQASRERQRARADRKATALSGSVLQRLRFEPKPRQRAGPRMPSAMRCGCAFW